MLFVGALALAAVATVATPAHASGGYRTPVGIINVQATCNPNDHTLNLSIDRGLTPVSYFRINSYSWLTRTWAGWSAFNTTNFYRPYVWRYNTPQLTLLTVYVELTWVANGQWRSTTIALNNFDQQQLGGWLVTPGSVACVV